MYQPFSINLGTAILFAFYTLSSVPSFSQCPTGNVTISTQDSLDNFIASQNTCDSINGNLTLFGSSIVDASGLSFLKVITGTLRISASNLTTIDGFENIIHIGNSLRIENIKNIEDINAISGNEIKTIPGDLIINNNKALKTIVSLNGIQSANNITISNNLSLQSLHGLQKVDSIHSTIKIDNNDSLVNLVGIDSLVYVGTNFIVEDHELLADCSLGCQYINSVIVQGQTIFRRNPSPCETTTEVRIYCQNTPCPSEDYILTTQGEVDAFVTTYSDCDTIMGSLVIDGNISNLGGLSFIKVITSDLTVRDNNIIDSVIFLENIANVGGDILIQNLDNLKGLFGFPGESLVSTSGNMTVRDNALLENVDDMDGITNIQGELLIRSNPALTSIVGLNKLTYVKDNLFISSNNSLESLQGIHNVNTVDGNLIIANHPLLTDCNAICLLVSSDGIAGLTSLNNNPFPCDGAANFQANCTPPPCSIGSVTISSQAELDSFSMANTDCDSLYGNVILQGGITSLNPMAFLRFLSGSLQIRNTSSLPNLIGLSNLVVQGELEIMNNNITSMTGIAEISPQSDIRIHNNNQLLSLAAMSSISIVNGKLEISENNLLSNLTGLENITSIASALRISDHDNITNIDALAKVSHIGSEFRLQRNSNLDDCNGICQIIDDTVVEGPIIINQNIENCNSLKELQLACTSDDCDGRDLDIHVPISGIDTRKATHSISSSSTISGDATWKAGFNFNLENEFTIEDMGLLQLIIIDRCD